MRELAIIISDAAGHQGIDAFYIFSSSIFFRRQAFNKWLKYVRTSRKILRQGKQWKCIFSCPSSFTPTFVTEWVMIDYSKGLTRHRVLHLLNFQEDRQDKLHYANQDIQTYLSTYLLFVIFHAYQNILRPEKKFTEKAHKFVTKFPCDKAQLFHTVCTVLLCM